MISAPSTIQKTRVARWLIPLAGVLAALAILLLSAPSAHAQQPALEPSPQQPLIVPQSAAGKFPNLNKPGGQAGRIIPDAQFDELQTRRAAAGLEPLPDYRKINPGDENKASAADKVPSNSAAVGILFWLFALMIVGGSIFVITRSNLISAVMGMVGTFFAIAVVYAMLYAHFLAAIQVLVYAGAIMVLFVFVIMILNKPEAEPWARTGLAGKVVVLGVILYLLARLVLVLWGIEPPPESLVAPGETIDGGDWGSTKEVGKALFTNFLFPFEAVSIVLLIAVVGAVAVARPHERPPAAIPQGVPGAAKPKAGSKS